jgi:phosphoribosylformylglycinamidine synthase subunit PurS
MIAITNRIATKEIGGKSRRPTLIASQVELQTTQSTANAATIGNFRGLGIAYHRISDTRLQLLFFTGQIDGIALVVGTSRSILAAMKVNVIVKPKEAVLDPQGNAVRDAMRHLGMPEVRSVRIGKYMEIDADGEDADLEKRLHGLCRDLLSNPVIEEYSIERSSE